MKHIPVIIDTDPGVDDVLALLLALASPELQVLAIVVSFGNTDANASYLNVLRVYQALSSHLETHPEERQHWPSFDPDRKVILARGANGPLQGDLHSAQYFHGRDGLGGMTERHPDLNLTTNYSSGSSHPQLLLSDKPGVEVVLDLIRSEASRSITYIVLGPMTTLAQAVRQGGSLVKDRIGRIVIMGGALDVPGNTSPVAEFNFFADPYAVHELFSPSPTSSSSSNLPSTLLPLTRTIVLPLDITTSHEIPFPYYAQHIDPSLGSPSSPTKPSNKSRLVYFTSSFLERTREIMLEFGKDVMELHDIAAVWCAIENPPVEDELPNEEMGEVKMSKGWKVVRRKFDIERTGELTRGMLVVDRRDDKGAYAPGANRAQVQAELEKHHFHPKGVLESIAVPAQVEVEDVSQAHPPSIQSVDANGIAEVAKDVEGGVPVVVETPGPEVLLKLLASRVWGVGR